MVISVSEHDAHIICAMRMISQQWSNELKEEYGALNGREGRQQAAAARLMSGWAGGLLMPEGARRMPGARCWTVQVRVFNNSSCCSGLVKCQAAG